MLLNVYLRYGHKLMEKEETPKGQSQKPPNNMDKGVLTEKQNLELPDGQSTSNDLIPQPEQGAISISAQQDLMSVVHPRDYSCLYINKS